MKLIEINGVRGYIDENGTAQLNLEDISRGLGFTTVATSGNDVVRWQRVNKYLTDMGFPQLVGKDYIPENIFYRLSMKAKNETAENFQAKVADEILPSIRKTGSYSVQPHKLPTFAEALEGYAAQLRISEELDAANKQLSLQSAEQARQLKEQEAPVAIYNLAMSAKNTMSMAEAAKALGTGRTRLYEILREEGLIMRGSTLPIQRYVDNGYFKVTERPRASGDTVVNDPATRVYAKGFDYIAKLMQKRAAQEERAKQMLQEKAERETQYGIDPILQ